jgi:hypothetical protein
MRKLFIILFLPITLSCYAPNITRGIIFVPTQIKINPYEQLMQAVIQVESNGNLLAYNEKEQAVGCLQIRQCRVDHFNQLSGKNYTLTDMYDYDKAVEVFMLFADKLQEPELIARRWNGSGPMTDIYWGKVKNVLEYV